jgi:HD-GYP domain-containing protein (c-di-GMP phosphodiesterase class II)
MSTAQSAAAPPRWGGRPVQAALVRLLAYVAPIAASITFVELASRALPAPLSSLWVYLLWWLGLTAAATGVLVVVDRIARRLLPLAALLKLSLVFPDQTPSRFKTAMRAGSTKKLEARMQELRDGEASPADSAALLLELVAALNSHDRVTRGHSERVRGYAVLIGEELGLSAEELDQLNWSALLHDVGKLSVPSAILNKPGRPDEEEWQLLKAHPLLGESLVEPLRPWLGEWVDAVGYHHERWDGAGYPRGIEGESIPLPGRIVAVADTYDVITSARSYKEAGSAVAGREEISRCAGSQFDPRVVRAFLGVSLGRMRLIMGPLSWLSHAPVLSQIPFGAIGSVVSGAAGVFAVATAGGLVTKAVTPARAAKVPALVRHVAPPATKPARARGGGHPPVTAGAPSAPPPPSTPTSPPPAPPTTSPTVPSPGTPSPPPAGSPSLTHAEDDSVTVFEGRSVSIDVLANDTNSNGDALAVTVVTSPADGSATVAHNRITYSAPSDWTGSTSFVYRAASRADGSADTAVVTVTVAAVNHPPSFVAGGDQSVTEDGGPQSVAGWATQMSPGPASESGQTISFRVSSDDPALFSASPAVAPDGTLTYTPAPDANGVADVTVAAQDDGGTAGGGADTSAPQSFEITVESVNDAPSFAAGGDQGVLEDSGVQSVAGWATQISAGPADEGGQTISFLVSNDDPALFSASPAVAPDGTLTYMPAPDANGVAHVTVAAQDDGGTAHGGSDTSATQSFTITVSPVNDAPSFVGGPDQTVLEDSGAQSDPGWATLISPGPADESGQLVSFNVQSDDPSLFSTQPKIGVDGTLTFTPAPDAHGTTHVTVSAQDDGGTANGGHDTSTPQSFTITLAPVNDAPSFVSGPDETVPEDAGPQALTAWATQINDGPRESGQVLTFTRTADTNPSLFSVAPAVDPATGTLSFTSAPNANGSATITFVLHDDGGTANGGSDTSAPQSVTITVSPVNDAPSFLAGPNQTVLEDSGAQSVAGWATQMSPGPPDESGQKLDFEVQSDTNPALFSVAPSVDSATGTLTFTSAPDAFGTATIEVAIHDDGGTANGGDDESAPQSLTIAVTPVNDAPSFVAGSDQTVIQDSGAQTVSGWATQIDDGAGESGQALDFVTTGDTNPALFSVAPSVDSATGTLVFTPASGVYGTATITLVLHDDGGTANGGDDTSAPQTFTILVAGPPTAQPDSFQGWMGSDVVGDLLANDTDPQGSPLTLDSTPATQPTNGTVTLSSADGTFVYVPNSGFTGTDGFSYTVSNGYGATATAQVTIQISASSGVSTSLVAAVNSKNPAPPYQVTTSSFTPAAGTTYLVFAGRVSSPGDIAVLSTTGSLDLPVGPLDATVGADGATHGWVWAVHGVAGGLPSTITVTFTRPNSKTVASDVLEVAQVGGSGVDHDTAQPGLISSGAATLALASPGASDSELALFYSDGDIAGDPGWVTPGIATLSGSVLHSPNGTTGYGALLAYAPQAVASVTTKKRLPAQDGNSYVGIAVDLAP